MKVKKCIIPAAGWGTRFLPLTKIVHKELVPVLAKPIIDYLIQEAFDAGIEEVYLILSPRKVEIMDYFRKYDALEEQLESQRKDELLKIVRTTNREAKIKVVYQNEQLGLGHAIAVARHKIKNEPFAVILGDDLIDSKTPCIADLIEVYKKTNSSVVGVTDIEISESNKYGIVIPKDQKQRNESIFEISGAIEKPNPEVAPSNKAIIGRYVFTPEIMNILADLKPGINNEIQLADAFTNLLKNQSIYAFNIKDQRYDLGSVEGFIKANIDFALKDPSLKETITNFLKSKKL
ncbi:UTP--glucose-1-phosphate uridylyltransferase [Mesomycoplasma conjunctivae]|uniref:UTP--glucose-1-phosphate uridylyltransferase n=1 Tax=Mesomycoplasma conjunctivae TaxID=45361 RepID=UPI003DA32440